MREEVLSNTSLSTSERREETRREETRRDGRLLSLLSSRLRKRSAFSLLFLLSLSFFSLSFSLVGNEMSGFSTFIPNPPTAYPQPSPHFISALGVPLPTNSWAENAVKGTVYHEGDPPGFFRLFPQRSRDTKPMPWFVSPYYGDADTPEPYITLGHATVGNITHSTEEGQNRVSIDARGFIDRVAITAGGVNLDLTSLDDGSATYSFSNGTTFYTSRGSPFTNIRAPNAEAIDLLFSSAVTLLGPSGIVAEERGAFRYMEIPFSRQQVTESVTTNYPPASGIYNFEIPIHSRYATTGVVTIQNLTFNAGQPQNGSVLIPGSTVAMFTNGVFTSPSGATYNSGTRTITSAGLQIILTPPLFRVLNTETVQGIIRFISNRIFTSNRSGGTVTLSLPPNSHLWMYVNDARTYYADPGLGYVTSIVATQAGNGSYTLTLLAGTGTAIYFYTPLWWREDYNVSGISYLPDTVYDVTYRECTLALTTQSVLLFTPGTVLPLPTLPAVPSSLNLEAFKERVALDTVYYANFSLAAYTLETLYVFAQNVSKYARILTFAQVTGILTPVMYTSFVSLLTTWLNETNGQVPGSAPGSNNLVKETLWGGIITLADYNVSQGIAGEGSFGNSFYNDHHFQYGYFFYALYTLSVIGQSATLLTYEPQVRQLLQDVVTAAGDGTSIATKTRHKDWYFGHSFATGLTDAVNIDQESVSEAINCYYNAWLLSGAMFTLTADVRYQSMRDVSLSALHSEVATYRRFWTQNGEIIDSPSTTIVQAFSKTFAAQAPGQPSSYPSSSLYRYSIITLPFSDITPLFIDRDWIREFASATTPAWQRVTRRVISGLCNYEKQIPNSWSYTPTPSPYDNNLDRAPEGITAWGFFGLQLLALGNAITEDEATRYWNKVNFKGMDLNEPLNEDVIKRFDSYSNAFYVLYEQADYNELPPVEGPEESSSSVNELALQESISEILSRLPSPFPSRVTRRDCPDDDLVEVPTIDISAIPTEDGLDVASVTFTIVDVIDYSRPWKCYRKKIYNQRIPTGLVPREETFVTVITLTQPECNFNSVLNALGTSLLQKCRNLNAVAPYVIQYTYIRWVLSSLLYDGFKLEYLHRNFTEKFFRDLVRSRFYLFYSEYFTSNSLIDYNGTLYDVLGYGNVPQNGKYYYIP